MCEWFFFFFIVPCVFVLVWLCDLVPTCFSSLFFFCFIVNFGMNAMCMRLIVILSIFKRSCLHFYVMRCNNNEEKKTYILSRPINFSQWSIFNGNLSTIDIFFCRSLDVCVCVSLCLITTKPKIICADTWAIWTCQRWLRHYQHISHNVSALKPYVSDSCTRTHWPHSLITQTACLPTQCKSGSNFYSNSRRRWKNKSKHTEVKMHRPSNHLKRTDLIFKMQRIFM